MTELDGYGSLNLGTAQTTNITIEATTAGGSTGGTRTITLKPSNASAQYALQLPEAAPTGKSIVQIASGGGTDDTVLNWTKTVDQTIEATLPATNAANHNRIASVTNTGNVYYGTSASVWKRINNWFTNSSLPVYTSEHTESITHDTSTDKFYIASSEAAGFYQVKSENYKIETFDGGGKDIVADINGTKTVIARPFAFDNLNLVLSHDAFTVDSTAWNNGIIVQKVLDAAFLSYVEWEFTNPGPILDSEFEKAIFGIIDKNVINNNGGTFTQGMNNWGFDGGNISKDNGLIGHFTDPTNTGDFYNNTNVAIPVMPDTFLGGNFNIKYGDSIQVCANGVQTIEIVIVRNGSFLASLSSAGFTINDFGDKRYYLTMGDDALKFRVSKSPNRYLGIALTPNTYVLNLANG